MTIHLRYKFVCKRRKLQHSIRTQNSPLFLPTTKSLFFHKNNPHQRNGQCVTRTEFGTVLFEVIHLTWQRVETPKKRPRRGRRRRPARMAPPKSSPWRSRSSRPFRRATSPRFRPSLSADEETLTFVISMG